MFPATALRLCSSASFLIGAALGGVIAPAAAQATLAPSPALACLTRIDGAAAQLDYPAAALAGKQGGTVRVQLTFTGPAVAPTVAVLARPPRGQFDSAVIAHVQQYRVPCMQAGADAVILTQEYLFDAEQQSRVMASRPRDSADAGRAAQLACMVHVDGAERPTWPKAALQRGDKGTVLTRLRFDSASAAPTVEVVQAPMTPLLRRAVAQYAAGLRLPCLKGAPVDTLVAYKFVYDNEGRVRLRDSSLIEALAGARDLQTPVQFDFHTMGCPFELRIGYYRPFGDNRVEQLDDVVAAREPLMDWLRGLTLNMSDNDSARMFGEKFVIRVPCAKLEL